MNGALPFQEIDRLIEMEAFVREGDCKINDGSPAAADCRHQQPRFYRKIVVLVIIISLH